MSTKHIPVEQITPNPEQPRKHFDESALKELADSIRVNGLVQPIIVQAAGDGYILVAGERRLRAHKLLGRTTIEAVVRPPAPNAIVGERDRAVQALVENMQRENLNPIEEAVALGKLREMNLSYTQIASWAGLALPTVMNRLKLLKLEPELQELIADGALPRDPRVCDALLSIDDSQARVQLGQRLARPGITIQAIVAACTRLREALSQPKATRDVRAPAVALLSKSPAPATAQSWRNVRAASEGMCQQCDANPKLPELPYPAWSLVVQAAEATCEGCSLRDMARQNNLTVCRACPSVELLRRLVANA